MPLIVGTVIALAILAGGAYIYLSGVSENIEADVADQLGDDDSTPRPTPTPEPIDTSGEVMFGLGLDEGLRVEEEGATFSVGELGSFSGSFTQPAGATALDVIISSRDAGGAETVIYTETVTISDPNFTIFGIEGIDLSSLVGNAPGDYVMRFYRDATELAEGTFTIVP